MQTIEEFLQMPLAFSAPPSPVSVCFFTHMRTFHLLSPPPNPGWPGLVQHLPLIRSSVSGPSRVKGSQRQDLSGVRDTQLGRRGQRRPGSSELH